MVLFTLLLGKYKLSRYYSPDLSLRLQYCDLLSDRSGGFLTQICWVISQVIVVAVLSEINDAGIKDYIDVFIDTEK